MIDAGSAYYYSVWILLLFAIIIAIMVTANRQCLIGTIHLIVIICHYSYSLVLLHGCLLLLILTIYINIYIYKS